MTRHTIGDALHQADHIVTKELARIHREPTLRWLGDLGLRVVASLIVDPLAAKEFYRSLQKQEPKDGV